MSNSNLYRKSVGAFLINKNKQVLIAKRLLFKNSWQLPQGGIEEGETPSYAVLRELLEEIGTNNVEILTETPPFRYDLTKELQSAFNYKHIGQEIIWFGMLFKGKDHEINLNYSDHPEFSEWRWEDPKNIIHLIVNFKKNMYKQLLQHMVDNKII